MFRINEKITFIGELTLATANCQRFFSARYVGKTLATLATQNCQYKPLSINDLILRWQNVGKKYRQRKNVGNTPPYLNRGSCQRYLPACQ